MMSGTAHARDSGGRLLAAFEAPIHHGALVVSSQNDAAELSEWDPAVEAYFRDSQSLIFAVQAAVDGMVRCEVWRGSPPTDELQDHVIAEEQMDLSAGWRVWDPEEVVRIALRPFRGIASVAVRVNDVEWPDLVQIIVGA